MHSLKASQQPRSHSLSPLVHVLVLTADTTRTVIGYFQDQLDVDEISSPIETTTEKKLVLLAK